MVVNITITSNILLYMNAGVIAPPVLRPCGRLIKDDYLDSRVILCELPVYFIAGVIYHGSK